MCRRINYNHKCRRFTAENGSGKPGAILTKDEAEALRLYDIESLYQEECALRMGVSRQTFGNIIKEAHRKVADAILNGKSILIEGSRKSIFDKNIKNKGEIMKVAIPVIEENGLKSSISDHFGSAPFFFVYDLEKKEESVIKNTNQHHAHGMCHPLSILDGKSIDAVVVRGMGQGAFAKLSSSGIRVYITDDATVEKAISKLMNDKLSLMTPGHQCMH